MKPSIKACAGKQTAREYVGVDKISCIVFSSVGPISPYIYELLSWYKTKRENSRSFEILSGYIWW